MKNKYKNPYGIYCNPYSSHPKKKSDHYKPKQIDYMKNYYEPPMMYLPIQMPVEDMNGMDEMDFHYMKRMYPDVCKKIQYWVDEECDKMEYEGSYMYDEYPDKEVIEMLTDKILDKMRKENIYEDYEMEVDVIGKSDEVETAYKGRDKRGDRWLRNLIKIMLLNEIFGKRRRSYRRRCKKHHYYPDYNYDYYQKPRSYQKPYQKPYQKTYQNPYSYYYPDYFE